MKRLFSIIMAILAVVIIGGSTVPVFAADDAAKEQACKAIGGSFGGGSCAEPGASGDTVNNLIATIVNLFSWVVGVVAVVFIIYGGFRYVTSGGDSGKITNAKNTIVYALVGLIIAVLAQTIVWFVVGKTTTKTTARITPMVTIAKTM